ncbi:MAG: DUF4097 family beta strand repeat protein [Bacteroidales bacterium]|nr:DUF4097 family beta strand repeat protein [Bacteroidales bacterium]
MKAQKFKFGILFIFIVAFGLTTAYTIQDEFTKKYHEEFDTNKNTELIIQNKFGEVDIKDWDKNLVEIDVVITVEHPDKERAERILSMFSVEISQEGNTIKAITKIDEKFHRMNRSWGNKGKRFSIDYTVNMPKDLKLDLSNKYGNTFINELTGEVSIEIKYGNLKANKILRSNTKPLSKLTLGYGKATIEEANWLKLDVKYCKGKGVEISKCKALVIVSKYSNIYVNEGSSIVAESKYDDYEIGHVTNFVCESGYTSYKFEQIDKKFDLTTKYGSVKVGYIPKDFESIKISNEYGGITLGIDENASYYLKGEAKYGKIQHPESGKLSRIIENTSSSVDGIIGSEESPKAKVNIWTKYGSVKLYD